MIESLDLLVVWQKSIILISLDPAMRAAVVPVIIAILDVTFALYAPEVLFRPVLSQ